MSELPYLGLIPGLPLLAAVLTAFLGPTLLRRHSHWPCVLAVLASCVLSFMVFSAVYQAPHEGSEDPLQIATYYPWIQIGEPDTPDSLSIGISLRADALSAMMLVMITFIGSFIAIYSIGYMHGDPGYPRFFAEIALFIFSMTTLVLADNFLLLYLGWEGVGLCSYLLIGFWFTKQSAADAARKAFLLTRIADVGLFLGILLCWVMSGYRLGYDGVFNHLDRRYVTVACLLIFCGAVGKSAQFPLHVWLPDAMEGPSPVSALIHAATMVTAGVYLVARCTPLFLLAPAAQLVVACIGGFTALLAALIALTQMDLKRVLAYSTLSQLGYMFLGLGSGVAATHEMVTSAGHPVAYSLVTFAVIAAMFHLFTHAFFKALLFLSAGSVMHAMGNVIDMRRFSGLRKVLPITHWTFLCGALALAGLPPFSGFWSKDEIIASTWKASHAGALVGPWKVASIEIPQIPVGPFYFVLWASALVTAGLTAFYTFRAYFLTFHGPVRIPEEAGHHAHESPAVMTVPLIVLAVFALGVGLVLGTPSGLFEGFLERAPGFPEMTEGFAHGPDWLLMGVSTLIALAGCALAWQMYVHEPDLPARLAAAARRLYQLSYNKFHFDEMYVAFIVKPLQGFTTLLRELDRQVIDGLVDACGHVPRLFGILFRPVQNGLVQFYALAMVLGLTVFLLALVRSL
jgi:NADH-quinone oxidoreductase subunit L